MKSVEPIEQSTRRRTSLRRAVLFLGIAAVVTACTTGPQGSAGGQGLSTATSESENRLDLTQLPVLLENDEDLVAFVSEYEALVENAANLHENLIVGSIEEERERLEDLRREMELWRVLDQQVVVNTDSTTISIEAYGEFLQRMNTLHDRLMATVLQINREIREANIAADAEAPPL